MLLELDEVLEFGVCLDAWNADELLHVDVKVVTAFFKGLGVGVVEKPFWRELGQRRMRSTQLVVEALEYAVALLNRPCVRSESYFDFIECGSCLSPEANNTNRQVGVHCSQSSSTKSSAFDVFSENVFPSC